MASVFDLPHRIIEYLLKNDDKYFKLSNISDMQRKGYQNKKESSLYFSNQAIELWGLVTNVKLCQGKCDVMKNMSRNVGHAHFLCFLKIR